jgi:hypothetical protein
VSDCAIRELDAATWDAFALLAEKHNGAGFGSWCTWCQYSSPEELPRIYHRKEYEATRTEEEPVNCVMRTTVSAVEPP